MKRINILDSKTARLIAAGEIAENPASVVKELLENSIDAGSTRITIEIKNGGLGMIRVSDNGHGIYREDIKDAFSRYATSKIKCSEEINKITSLGFRGEALASIAAVSKVEIFTKAVDEPITGSYYKTIGGTKGKISEVGCAVGTNIIVKDLFFNTPARMKFMKSPSSEGNKVASIVDKIALSHPEVFFKFIRENKVSFCSAGDGKISSAIYTVYGKDFFESTIPINFKSDKIEINGFISKPEACRPSKNMQIFFVNGRFIKSKLISSALEDAFKNSVMKGKNPYGVLHINVSPEFIDVNVHPAKTEIKFADETNISEAVYSSVRNGLENESSGTSIIKKYLNNVFENNDFPDKLETKSENISLNDFIKDSGFGNIIFNPKILSTPTEKLENENSEIAKPKFPIKSNLKLASENFKIIGEIFGCYILIQCKNVLILIDKHAAHERIIFEKLKSQSRQYDSQVLIKPVVVTLEKEEYFAVIKNFGLFEKAGYEIEDFGHGSVIVRSAPMYEDFNDLSNSVIEIANCILDSKKNTETKKLDWIYHNIACRSAIKAKSKTSVKEIVKLVRDIMINPNLRYCPHGRPIYIEIDKSVIEKRFGRI